jgi:hypothetical protein
MFHPLNIFPFNFPFFTQTLTELNLSSNQIGLVGIYYLAYAIQNNKVHFKFSDYPKFCVYAPSRRSQYLTSLTTKSQTKEPSI